MKWLLSLLFLLPACLLNKPWGQHLTLDVHGCDHGKITSAENISDFITTLSDRIAMKRYGDPVIVKFGYGRVEGYSMFQLIETSNISGHFVDESNRAFIDVFSCKYFNPDLVVNLTEEFFGGEVVKFNLLERD